MNALGRPVIDKTNFAGTFDLHIEYAPEMLSGDADAPSIFSALQDQLGLRLEPAKGPAELLVIDHVARPSEN